MKFLPRVFAYLRPYWRLAAFSVLLTVLAALTGLAAPWPLGVVMDNVIGNQPLPGVLASFTSSWLAAGKMPLLVAVVVAGLIVAMLHHGIAVLQNYVTTTFEQKMILDFRSDLFEHAQRLSMAFHDQKRAGGLIYAINFQADAAAGVIMAVQPMVQSAVSLVGMFWLTYQMNPTLALLSLCVVPFLYYSVGYYATHIQERLVAVKTMEGESLSIIHEAMSMLRVIVAFGREPHEYGRFRRQGERAVTARIALTLRQTLFGLAVNMITAIGTALVLGYGGYLAVQGQLTAGQLTVVIAYVAAIYGPLEAISTTIGSLQDQFVSLRMAFELLDTQPEIQDAPDAVVIERAKGAVRFENVEFSYQGRIDTLKNVSFEAQPGQVIAVCGPTGAGKTTLISLLPRFYDAKSGRVLLDGTDTRQLSLKALRRQIAFVQQEPLLFSASIADNIRYGRLDATQEEIVAAAQAANAHDFISRLPKGYDTLLGERGATLSGGERQRIAVARAFLKDAPILILDEPTSAIDSKTEAVILDALDRLMQGRTTFMIAHRLATIRNADLILVMHHGEVAERGTHEELLARGGLYKQLSDLQTAQARRRTRLPSAPPA
ncbi:MAG: ABC transporter ATP-binding protein/permease [Chthoniobacter sp.]|nr:ABC transporter ATP-binding protein/permease [Chthoniobacter sp.]